MVSSKGIGKRNANKRCQTNRLFSPLGFVRVSVPSAWR
nr:MAG TPA: hypothetical protein [Caudoviricetes sp.]